MAEEIGELDITDELIAERNSGAPGETPDDMTPWFRPIIKFIDLLNLWVGRLACLLSVPLLSSKPWLTVAIPLSFLRSWKLPSRDQMSFACRPSTP